MESAKIVAKELNAGGSTHMIGALEVSLFLVNRAKVQWKNHQPIIVFLTDGEPTDGVKNPDQITDIVSTSRLYWLYIRNKDNIFYL